MAYPALPPTLPASNDAVIPKQVRHLADSDTARSTTSLPSQSGTSPATHWVVPTTEAVPAPPEATTLEFSAARPPIKPADLQANRPSTSASDLLPLPAASPFSTPAPEATPESVPSAPIAPPALEPVPEAAPPASEASPVVPELSPPAPPTPANSSPAAEEPSTPTTSDPIAITKINIIGSTILTPNELAALTQPLEGKSLPLSELQSLADKVTQLYLDRGYITSRAILNRQTVQAGVVELQVIEGSLERIDIEGTQRLNPNYIRRRIQLGAGTPLNTARLEDQLRLLRADPLFRSVEASLRAGNKLGQSILIVRVKEASAVEGSLNADNYSPPSVGSEQFGFSLGYRNLTGIGDQLFGSYSITGTGGAENVGVGYRVPLNPMNGTLQLRANWNNNKITQEPFDVLDIRGDSELYELNYRQPLVRSPREEFALSLGLAYQNGQTFTFNNLPTPFGIGPDINGVSRTSVIKFGQDYLRRDTRGAWALRSQFNFGTGLFDATRNPGTDIPDGQFFSWLGQVQRVQRLNDSNLLILQADVQLTPDSLLPSQQFVIGGGQSLRGYRQNVRSGDNGFRLSAENRITINRDANGSPTVQLAPFVEAGAIWNVNGNPNPLPERTFLASVGIGLLWQPIPRLSVRVDYGIPLVSIRDKGNNAQDDGVHFSVGYQF